MPDDHHDKCTAGIAAACGYAVLTMLALPLFPGSAPLMAAEVMVPFMAWQCWRQRREIRAFLRDDAREALFAAAWAAAAVAAQFIFTGSGAVYDLAILGYMLFIYAFFRVTPLPPKIAFCTGALLLFAIFAGWVLTGLGMTPSLNFADPNMVPGESGGILALRYQFLFNNPNMLGSAFILPVALMLPQLRLLFGEIKRPAAAILAVVCIATLCLPLLATVSKHLILTLALLGGICAAMPALAPCKPRLLLSLLLTTAIAGALVTVWFCTAPAVKTPPWVDFSRRGNYTTHQEVYLNIITSGGIRGMLTGYSPARLREEYPKHADREKIAGILRPYGAEKLTDTFASFMDPHNEYLNFASHFGIPALILLLIFMGKQAATAAKKQDFTTLLFICALLATFFWEDMASKRWIWATLGILTARKR